MNRRKKDEDEDKGRVKKEKIAVYLEIGDSYYFVTTFTRKRDLNRSLSLMRAANPNRSYVTEVMA